MSPSNLPVGFEVNNDEMLPIGASRQVIRKYLFNRSNKVIKDNFPEMGRPERRGLARAATKDLWNKYKENR